MFNTFVAGMNFTSLVFLVTIALPQAGQSVTFPSTRVVVLCIVVTAIITVVCMIFGGINEREKR